MSRTKREISLEDEDSFTYWWYVKAHPAQRLLAVIGFVVVLLFAILVISLLIWGIADVWGGMLNG